jgi:hypothetical protein
MMPIIVPIQHVRLNGNEPTWFLWVCGVVLALQLGIYVAVLWALRPWKQNK